MSIPVYDLEAARAKRKAERPARKAARKQKRAENKTARKTRRVNRKIDRLTKKSENITAKVDKLKSSTSKSTTSKSTTSKKTTPKTGTVKTKRGTGKTYEMAWEQSSDAYKKKYGNDKAKAIAAMKEYNRKNVDKPSPYSTSSINKFGGANAPFKKLRFGRRKK